MNERPELSDVQLGSVDMRRFFGPKIADLTRAIENASEASGRHARALIRATWVLAAATVVLAASTIVLVIVTASR